VVWPILRWHSPYSFIAIAVGVVAASIDWSAWLWPHGRRTPPGTGAHETISTDDGDRRAMSVDGVAVVPFEWRLPYLIGRGWLARLVGTSTTAELFRDLSDQLRSSDVRERRVGALEVAVGWFFVTAACAVAVFPLLGVSLLLFGHPSTTWPLWPLESVGIPCAVGATVIIAAGALPPRHVSTRLVRVLGDAAFLAVSLFATALTATVG
jgi:hypothetical protein